MTVHFFCSAFLSTASVHTTKLENHHWLSLYWALSFTFIFSVNNDHILCYSVSALNFPFISHTAPLNNKAKHDKITWFIWILTKHVTLKDTTCALLLIQCLVFQCLIPDSQSWCLLCQAWSRAVYRQRSHDTMHVKIHWSQYIVVRYVLQYVSHVFMSHSSSAVSDL